MEHSESQVAALLETLHFEREVAGEEDFNAAVKAVTKLLNHVPEKDCPKVGLLVSGNTGVGKTHLVNQVLKVLKFRGENILRIDLGNENHLNYFRGDFQDFYGIDPFSMTVFLDDIGAEKPVYDNFVLTERVIQFIWTFHSCAAVMGGRLIGTTNLHGDLFDQRYGARTYSRLKEIFIPLKLTGEDKRKWLRA